MDNFPFDDDVLSVRDYEQGINEVADAVEESIEAEQEFLHACQNSDFE